MTKRKDKNQTKQDLYLPRVKRREFLRASAGGMAGAWMSAWPWQKLAAQQDLNPFEEDWDSGIVRHLLPAVNESRILIKASFNRALGQTPQLQIQNGSNNKLVEGFLNDTAGEFWQFYATELQPDTEYELSLQDSDGNSLCESWPLSTFPSPQQNPERVRVLFYSCAGGREGEYFGIGDRRGNLPIAIRQRLLRRGLSFAPQAAVANGDHIYWDLHTWQGEQAGELSPQGQQSNFDFAARVMGGSNEEAMKLAAGPQIIPLYGTAFRSTPVYFLQDDHDHWENDSPLTYPVPWFQLQLARTTQQLYYPEFLPDVTRSSGLPYSTSSARGELSESFGTLRYGQLLEVLLYDVRRTLNVGELNSVFLDSNVENWLAHRTASSDTRHLVHVPSNPPGWTAGKWGEWYPDVLHPETGQLTTQIPKPHWRQGWLDQHDRIMQSLADMKHRNPLVIAGDLHATGVGTMHAAGYRNFDDNPITNILCGPVGTSTQGFPSVVRGVRAAPSQYLNFQEQVPPFEEHGFTIVDFEQDKIVAKLFKWDVNSQPLDAIDTLQPYHTVELDRP
ncbi:MAG: alkaline phosphatase D family protein [Gammaproteobacteria bacterium]|jgi:hypothetical protein|nr:alkaline phosphatase D family protein [Gammaproteobacteria bacterium]